MIFANTKERILHYLEYKGISISKFFKETGIKRGFLDTDKLQSSVSDNFLAIIIATYEDLNLYWVLLEKGEMLLEISADKKKKNEVNEPFANNYKVLQNDKEKIIHLLEEQVRELRKDKEELYKIINTKIT